LEAAAEQEAVVVNIATPLIFSYNKKTL
jgi:hypothetical protein